MKLLAKAGDKVETGEHVEYVPPYLPFISISGVPLTIDVVQFIEYVLFVICCIS